MHHRFLVLLLIFSSLSAQEEIKPYLTSECDSLSLVEGVVNARNSKLVQIEQDITVQGSSPLQITRYYDGGHHYNSRFGYGFGLSLPTHMRLRRKDGKLSIFVEQRMGSSVPYLASLSLDKFNRKYPIDEREVEVDPDLFDLGYTNCCESLLRGESSIFATRIRGNKNKITVILGDGTLCHYERVGRDEHGTYHFRLELEERPNRTKRRYTYVGKKSFALEAIRTTNLLETLTLNALYFTYNGSSVGLEASNGQFVRYCLASIEGKAKDGKCKEGYR